MVEIYFKGLALGAGLIIAIGAQNAFVLSQGVRRKYNIIIPLICSVSDAVLISIGVLGVGQILASNELISNIASIGGALFLGWYGLRSFRSFLKPGHLDESDEGPQSLKAAVLFTMAVTLLNPHVYIDTILLLGGISSQFEGNGRYVFGAGAVSASFLWFFTLSLGGRILSPVFKSPLAWKILDLIIAGIMWSIAFSLIKSLFGGPEYSVACCGDEGRVLFATCRILSEHKDLGIPVAELVEVCSGDFYFKPVNIILIAQNFFRDIAVSGFYPTISFLHLDFPGLNDYN